MCKLHNGEVGDASLASETVVSKVSRKQSDKLTLAGYILKKDLSNQNNNHTRKPDKQKKQLFLKYNELDFIYSA